MMFVSMIMKFSDFIMMILHYLFLRLNMDSCIGKK